MTLTLQERVERLWLALGTCHISEERDIIKAEILAAEAKVRAETWEEVIKFIDTWDAPGYDTPEWRADCKDREWRLGWESVHDTWSLALSDAIREHVMTQEKTK